MPRKMEANESIILQMNKERLRLERQLSELMKASCFLYLIIAIKSLLKNIILFSTTCKDFESLLLGSSVN